jgi:enamine deaminase RidA (YjgF/YER057c/UK114 family)
MKGKDLHAYSLKRRLAILDLREARLAGSASCGKRELREAASAVIVIARASPRRRGHFFQLAGVERMGAEQKALELGIAFPKKEKGYLNLCVRTGNLLMTSGHVSDLKGKLGANVTVEQGYQAARDCAVKILQSVHDAHGTLDGLRVLKVLGCVNSTLEFTEQHLVVNGCSDLLHQLFGKDGDGFHARSALGFANLPTGAAVEVEAIFEIL